ncbi:hypothetical protein, partial [Klebsiella pneumoniae]|uniref:hypothetical protein n=1 Tax=Klebsiella pneumoniae TaxID=573 RepID=UPI002730F297
DGMNQSVAAATEEQTAVVETLNVDINQINLLNQQGVTNLNETLKDCDALSQQASWVRVWAACRRKSNNAFIASPMSCRAS